MPVTVFHSGEGFCKMHMFAAAYVNGTGRFSAEFMIMAISKVCAEFYLVEMIIFTRDRHGFTGYCTKSVVMAVFAFLEYPGTSSYFVDMFLFTAILVIHEKITPYYTFLYSMQ